MLRHFIVSLFKSVLRIFGGIVAIVIAAIGNIFAGILAISISIISAEILGVIEELVDDRR